jgi:hypothetical protein
MNQERKAIANMMSMLCEEKLPGYCPGQHPDPRDSSSERVVSFSFILSVDWISRLSSVYSLKLKKRFSVLN